MKLKNSKKIEQYIKLLLFVFTSFGLSLVIPFIVTYAVQFNLMECIEKMDKTSYLWVVCMLSSYFFSIIIFGVLMFAVNSLFAIIWDKIYIYDYMIVYESLIRIENACKRNKILVPKEVLEIRCNLKLFDPKTVKYRETLNKVELGIKKGNKY